MTHATYLPRVAVHPDRYGVKKSGRNILMVVHDSEGGEGATAGKNLTDYMRQPGDRPTSGGGVYGSSYHGVPDLNLTAWPCVPFDTVSYSATGANHNGIHLCLPGKAAQTREQWLDATSRSYIRTLAAMMVDISESEDIPLVRLTVAQVRDGASGYCSHHDVSLAFGKSTHTDPGPNFPWDVLAADILSFSTPELPSDPKPEEKMKPIHAVYAPDPKKVSPANNKYFGLLADGSIRHLTGPDTAFCKATSVQTFPIEGDEHYQQLDHLSKVNEPG